ncbi:MAG: ABC transporter permease [Acidobacteria bacterium]|nr:ABC transporter permease [Acidobacteriota bacterium]
MSASPILHTPQQVADRRSAVPHTSMFVRMLIRAAVLRRGRAASALFAMVVAAAVATAMMNLYVDVQAKLRTEFRSYGANVVVVARESQPFPSDALRKIESTLGPKTLAVPFSYAVARTQDGQSVVVVGTDFARAHQLNHWWNVSRWPSASGDALIGMRAATVVSPERKPFDLTFQGRTLHLTPAGLLQTGAGEDSRIYLEQSEFTNWTGVAPSTIEIAVNGTTTEIEQQIQQLGALLPTADVHPVRQIMEGEANVLNKTRATLYAAATLIVLTSALCVLATLIGWVFDRRRDFAIMKALGASERLVNGFFAAEAAALGAIGAVLGFAIGIGVAVWIGRTNFHAPVVPRFSVFPYVLAGSILVALISAVVPIGLLRRVQPALILRGE